MSRTDVTPRITVDLQGVPETLLWNLYFRATEARRPDAVLRDQRAVELIDSIDYPFQQRFGKANPVQAQAQALRARAFDLQVTGFLERNPDATVVALGEGLETQAWRVDNGQVRWLTVELPETAKLRRSLLPDSPRHRILAGSALDDDWMEQVDPTHAVLISAQGLLMYFQPDDVHRLIERCGERFPGAVMLFDAMPRWFSQRTLAGQDDEQAWLPAAANALGSRLRRARAIARITARYRVARGFHAERAWIFLSPPAAADQAGASAGSVPDHRLLPLAHFSGDVCWRDELNWSLRTQRSTN